MSVFYIPRQTAGASSEAIAALQTTVATQNAEIASLTTSVAALNTAATNNASTFLTNAVEPSSGSTLTLGCASGTSDVLIGCGTGIQRVKIGSTGGGQTDITVGGPTDNVYIGGTLTYVQSTDLQVTDKTITLNKGGLATSAGGAGISIEEGGSETAYMKLDVARSAILMKAPVASEVSTADIYSSKTTLAAATSSNTGSTLMSRDTYGNVAANSVIEGYTTTATSGGTTTLTVASTQQQFFTGTSNQTVTLPVVSTLQLGQSYKITNNSTGLITVQSSGGNTLQAIAPGPAMQPGSRFVATVISTSGTGTASWAWDYCLLFPTKEWLIATLASPQTSNLAVGDHIAFDSTLTWSGTNIVATSGTYTTTVGANCVGRFFLKALKVYKIRCSISECTYTNTIGANAEFVIWNSDTNSAIAGSVPAFSYGGSYAAGEGGAITETIFVPSTDTRIEVRITSAYEITGIGAGTTRRPYIYIELWN